MRTTSTEFASEFRSIWINMDIDEVKPILESPAVIAEAPSTSNLTPEKKKRKKSKKIPKAAGKQTWNFTSRFLSAALKNCKDQIING